MKKFLICLLSFLLLFTGICFAGEKQLTITWEQDANDLPENGGNLSYWTLYSSQDGNLPNDQWKQEGQITYTAGNPLSHDFIITAPDGAETPFYFKMTATGTDGSVSAFSSVHDGAPTVVDFKPPLPAVLSASYSSSTKTVTLTWTVDANDTDVVLQKVYKSSTSGGPYTDIAPLAGSLTSPYDYQVDSSDSGKYLYFVVVLTDTSGNFSQNSNEVAVKLAMGVPFNIKVTVKSQ